MHQFWCIVFAFLTWLRTTLSAFFFIFVAFSSSHPPYFMSVSNTFFHFTLFCCFLSFSATHEIKHLFIHRRVHLINEQGCRIKMRQPLTYFLHHYQLFIQLFQPMRIILNYLITSDPRTACASALSNLKPAQETRTGLPFAVA